MKQLILTIIATLSAVYAIATVDKSSKEYTTEQETAEALLNNNFKKISELNDKYEDIDYVLESFAKCEAKNMIYLGENVKGADNDDCVDVQNITIKRKSTPPVFVGFSDNEKYGTLTSTLGSYNPADNTQSWHRLKADEQCKAEHAGSRAMTYDDIKFVLKDLKVVNGEFDHPSSAKKVWVFDVEQSRITPGDLGTRFDSNLSHNNCNGWTSGTSSNRAIVLEIKSNTFNDYIVYNENLCHNKALIACVQ